MNTMYLTNRNANVRRFNRNWQQKNELLDLDLIENEKEHIKKYWIDSGKKSS